MLDNPRSATVGLSLVLKFGLDPVYSFGDIAIFIFCRFGLKLLIHAHFFRGGIGSMLPPNMVIHRSNPKMTVLVRKHVVWAMKRENWVQRFDLGAGSRKKIRTGQSKKSQSGNILPFWGEAPTVPIETKICVVGNLADVIMHAKFQDDILGTIRFHRGSNFPFFYWSLHGPYNIGTLQRYRAACDDNIVHGLRVRQWPTINSSLNSTAIDIHSHSFTVTGSELEFGVVIVVALNN